MKPAQIAAIHSYNWPDPSTPAQMIANVKATRVVGPSEYLESLRSVSNRAEQIENYLLYCGPLGLSFNALSFDPTIALPEPGVFMCPGALLRHWP